MGEDKEGDMRDNMIGFLQYNTTHIVYGTYKKITLGLTYVTLHILKNTEVVRSCQSSLIYTMLMYPTNMSFFKNTG